MKNDNPLEKVIERKVCEYARSKGVMAYKFISPGNASIPDRLFILPTGQVFFVEFKRLGLKPTKAQYVEIEKIRKQKVLVFVVDNIPAGKKVIDDLLGMNPENY